MTPASAGSPKGQDATGGLIAEGDNIAVGVADAPDTIAISEAVEAEREAIRFLLWQYDRGGPLADCKEAWDVLRSAIRARTAETQSGSGPTARQPDPQGDAQGPSNAD